MADIPGIIEGASDGKGLGLEFLRHIERTKTLLFMIDITNYRDMRYQYEQLKEELKRYSNELSEKPFAIAITKIDAFDLDEINRKTEEFLDSLEIKANSKAKEFGADSKYISYMQDKEEWEEFNLKEPLFILPISSVSRVNLDALKYMLFQLVKMAKESELKRIVIKVGSHVLTREWKGGVDRVKRLL